MGLGLWLPLVLVLVAALWLLRRLLRPVGSVFDRRAALQCPDTGGQTILLSKGWSHYWLRGDPATATLAVVCCHGIGTGSWVFDPMIDKLMAEKPNCCVLTFDFYGRGRSEFLDTVYSMDLLAGQALELTKVLKLDSHPLLLVGHSMGAAVVAHIALTNKNTVGLFLLSPAGFPTLAPKALAFVRHFPLLSDLVMYLFFYHLLKDHVKHNIVHPSASSVLTQRYIDQTLLQTQSRLYVRTYLSTLRNFPIDDCAATYRQLGARPKLPIWAAWGEVDKVLAFENARTAKTLMPQLELYPIPDAGHILVLEVPDQLGTLLHGAVTSLTGEKTPSSVSDKKTSKSIRC